MLVLVLNLKHIIESSSAKPKHPRRRSLLHKQLRKHVGRLWYG